ncbi:hypothetical protein D6777_04545 [Candidatus Woesearchaeota archaeon]|nr:MAG: hypothetical protein D6777_04545 [Candidatus Woesearchaeota archaeon]
MLRKILMAGTMFISACIAPKYEVMEINTTYTMNLFADSCIANPCSESTNEYLCREMQSEYNYFKKHNKGVRTEKIKDALEYYIKTYCGEDRVIIEEPELE